MHLTLLVGATIRYLPDNIPTEEWGTAIYDASNMLDPRVTLMWFFDAAGRRALPRLRRLPLPKQLGDGEKN